MFQKPIIFKHKHKSHCKNPTGTDFVISYKEKRRLDKLRPKTFKISAIFCDSCCKIHVKKVKTKDFDKPLEVVYEQNNFQTFEFQISYCKD